MPNYLLGTAIDWMHSVYGGVGKKVLLLLLSTKKKAKAWSISKYQSVLNDRLLNIKPPAHITRVPRSLTEIKYFKTSEWKTWLNDYSLPVLNGVLPDSYLLHHGSLVAAAHLLNANEVPYESLTVAENLLKKYVAQFSDFYHPDYLTINIHLLLHLHSVVVNQGAAWVYTCFPLESLNGVILSLVHGTRWAEQQIATSVQTCLALPEIVSKLPESEAKQFCSKVMKRRKYQGAEVVNGSAIIGKTVLLNQEDVPPHIVSTLEKANIKYRRLKQFHSLKRGKFLYVALSSNASVCRDSSAAVYSTCNGSNVGLIETFFRVYNCDCMDCSCDSTILALVTKCEVVMKFKTLIPEVFVPNVAEYKTTKEYDIVCPTNLLGVCVKMIISEKLYLAKPTNTMEVE
ncbi:Solute carrier family 12 member 4 [Frankliniella fusca]|uniref:Solute carrier family 12 member 4 n=1 Tax=Frankliniella fusca TaxID=407009 RepID=A0AAE1HP10_9NEOP|nr:Solute carrier family 12 member 4 [Frankliniella fusca]